MAAGVDITIANVWTITYNGSSASHTLPFQVWPYAGYAGPPSPFIVKRAVWISKTASQGDEVIFTDLEGNPIGIHFVATGADYEPPQEWKRAKDESAPYGAILTTFGSGELSLFF